MKSDLSIVVTDSGLGGLSVMAELDKHLRETPIAKNIKLIFFNAVADKQYGYNMMNNDEERAALFNSVLEGMVKWYKPDIIMMACNTLSILYPKTGFAKKTGLQVLGIVDFGVDLVYKSLSDNPKSIVVLLGTPMTINSGAHKKRLVELGIEPGRIIEQPCFMLESEIQDNPFGKQTRDMINKYLAEAKDKTNTEYNELFAALCCTHFNYSHRLFQEELNKIFSCPSHILNPNNSMSTYLTNNVSHFAGRSIISTEVVGRVPVLKEEIEVLGPLLKKESESVYESFINYHQKKDLF